MMTVQIPRLLSVDDDLDSAELVVRVAERCGFEGFATSDSRGVMNLSNALKPIVLSIDICMPNINAEELIELLAEARYDGYIIIVSGQKQQVLDQTSKLATDSGLRVLGAMQKPLDYSALRKMLSQLDEESLAVA